MRVTYPYRVTVLLGLEPQTIDVKARSEAHAAEVGRSLACAYFHAAGCKIVRVALITLEEFNPLDMGNRPAPQRRRRLESIAPRRIPGPFSGWR